MQLAEPVGPDVLGPLGERALDLGVPATATAVAVLSVRRTSRARPSVGSGTRST